MPRDRAELVDEEIVADFKEALFVTVQVYRRMLSDEVVLTELIGTLCAHICTTELLQRGAEVDSFAKRVRNSLDAALKSTGALRIYQEHGAVVWPTKDDIDA